MTGALVFIGDELTSGLIENTNSRFAVVELNKAGFEVREVAIIPDRTDLICKRLREFLEDYDFVVLSGGLGPTDDDLTTLSVAKALRLPLEENEDISSALKCSTLYAKTQELAIKMALLPKGAIPLSEDLTVAGYYLEVKGKPIFCLPGVPRQFEELLTKQVIPLLRKKFSLQKKTTTLKTFLFFDVNETELNKFLRKNGFKDLKVGYYPSLPYLKLVAKGEEERLSEFYEALRKEFFWWLVGEKGLEKVIGDLLRESGRDISVAESCTGGKLSSLITSVPGSSDYFKAGLVTYAVEAKLSILGVSRDIVEGSGVVSYETAMEMARCVKELNKTYYGIGITGYAGPGGGEPGKPVGTVFVGFAWDNRVFGVRFEFKGAREEIQTLVSFTVLDVLRRKFIVDKGGLSLDDKSIFSYRFTKGVKSRNL